MTSTPMLFVRYECGSEDRMSREYGPYEYVQLTYNDLTTLEGELLASLDLDGYWYPVAEHGVHYSDVVIAPTIPGTTYHP